MEGVSFLLDRYDPSEQTSVSPPSPALPLILALIACAAAENDNQGIYAEEQLGF